MELRTEIEIAAAPIRVWQALTQLGDYPRWNPFVTEIAGKLAVGERLSITYSFLDGTEIRFRPELTVVRPPEELRWRARLWWRNVFDTEHCVVLSEVRGSQTRLAQVELVTGWAVNYMGRRLTQTARGMVGMNEALKRVVEQHRSS
jgi:hypothetical protein